MAKAWIRVDADVFAHPKFAGITPTSFVAWLKGLGHCRQFRTDGVLERRVVSAIASPRVRADLLERELWHLREDGGIEYHDYGVYQLTEKKAQQFSEAGKKAALFRWDNVSSIEREAA